MPEGWDQPGDLFQLEEKVCRHDAVGNEAVRELEAENARLKKIVADLSLDKEMLQDVIKRKL